MPIWFQILTGIFAIVGVAYSIAITVIQCIYRHSTNKLTPKNLSISLILEETEVPYQYKRHSCKAYNCFMFYTNKTNRRITVHSIKFIANGKILELSQHEKNPITFTIEPNSNYVYLNKFLVLPEKFQFCDTATIELNIVETVLTYLNVPTKIQSMP